jgi:predicted glycogen debranching enzyme
VIEPDPHREWLETNGIGGYASSTTTGLNSRRYHGLLVAATRPPVGRMVLLSKFEETLIVDGKRFDLSTNRYPGVIHPQGYTMLTSFRRDPFPVFVFEIEGLVLEKSVFMVRGENTTVIQYEVRGMLPAQCRLELRPLIAFRDYHSTTHENGYLNGSLGIAPGIVTCAPYPDCPKLHLAHTEGEVSATGDWYRNFEYAIDQERGLEYQEDLFNPCLLTVDLHSETRASMIASTEPRDGSGAEQLRFDEIARREALDTAARSADPFVRDLTLAADQFLVTRDGGSTVIAGYHWFSDWGRDTMIALPGLTLSTGRHQDARGILLAFANSVDRGMLPNRFPDAGEALEYNTVDATLWYFEAVRAYAAHTEDYEFVRTRLYDILRDIIVWHERGTRYGIHVDTDGLLHAGETGVQLTWMDAKVGDWVVTPRRGKPVEIQALWHHALRIMECFAGRFDRGEERTHYAVMADRVKASFAPLFWNESAGCLYDLVNGSERDASIRPNQIFAVSLEQGMLSSTQAKSVVSVVEQHLLTPYGLRSLSPRDPQYRGRYEGNVFDRDSAYHQGTVWPWLIGPFITAYLNVHGRSGSARQHVARWVEPFRSFIAKEGLGQIPEVFDGDAPHRPGGCYAQAWSVAELLRSAVGPAA